MLETVITDLVAQMDTLTNTVLALEQRVTFLEDQQKENMEPADTQHRFSGNSANQA